MIKVLYATFEHDEYLNGHRALFRELPQYIHHDAARYRRPQDRIAKLLGKLLLLEGLKRMNATTNLIHTLQYTEYNRPYIDAHIDFNISHTAGCVVCALSNTVRVGVDIEKIQPIEMSDFDHIWTPAERAALQRTPHPYQQFYTYWTRKEAVLKADGRGMNLTLTDINVTGTEVMVDQNRWYLTPLPLVDGHVAHLATSLPTKDPVQPERFVCIP